jgi:hypothetical protein
MGTLDVPVRSLALTELGERLTARRAGSLNRMGRWLTQRLNTRRT